MSAPVAILARGGSGALVADHPRTIRNGEDFCATRCAGDEICDGGFGCPYLPDPLPPSEDEYERFVEAEIARGRP